MVHVAPVEVGASCRPQTILEDIIDRLDSSLWCRPSWLLRQKCTHHHRFYVGRRVKRVVIPPTGPWEGAGSNSLNRSRWGIPSVVIELRAATSLQLPSRLLLSRPHEHRESREQREHRSAESIAAAPRAKRSAESITAQRAPQRREQIATRLVYVCCSASREQREYRSAESSANTESKRDQLVGVRQPSSGGR